MWFGRLWSVAVARGWGQGRRCWCVPRFGWVPVALLWLVPRCCGRGCDGPSVPAAEQTRSSRRRGRKRLVGFGGHVWGHVSGAAWMLRRASPAYSGTAGFGRGVKLVPAQHSEVRLELPVPTWPWQSLYAISRDPIQLWAVSCAWILRPAPLGQVNLARPCTQGSSCAKLPFQMQMPLLRAPGAPGCRGRASQPPTLRHPSGTGPPGARWGLSAGPCSTQPSWEGAQWCRGSPGHAPPGARAAELAVLECNRSVTQ